MNIACPHCRGRYLPVGEVFANGAAMLGERSPLRCPSCGGLSYVQLTGRNTTVALGILFVGITISYPSPVSIALLAGFPHYEAGAIRANIWIVAFLAAFAVFLFACPLKKVERDAPAPRRSLLAFLSTMAFLGSLLLYGYFLFRS